MSQARIHQGVHVALDRLFAGMVETQAVEGQAVIRQSGLGAVQLTLKILGDDEPPVSYHPEDIKASYSGLWDPATGQFVERPHDT